MSEMPEKRSLLDEHSQSSSRTVDPLFTLQVPLDAEAKHSVLGSAGSRSSVTSVCFVPRHREQELSKGSKHEAGSESDSSDNEEPIFRCRTRALVENKGGQDAIPNARNAAASSSLSGSFLASSHTNGDSFLWDLGRRRIASEFCSARGPGLALRRMGQHQIMYHTRDDRGTVSIHDIASSSASIHSSAPPSCPVIVEYQTLSRTFCAASPCAHNAHLLALPSEDEAAVTIRDLRVSPRSASVVQFHGSGQSDKDRDKREHGMLTALAMSEAFVSSASWPVVACGMESGSVFFHDLKMTGRPLESAEIPFEIDQQQSEQHPQAAVKLGNNPILSLDMAQSTLPSSSSGAGSVVAIAGMAGDAADISELPESERGTVAVLKAVFPFIKDGLPTARLRSRVPTCRVSDDSSASGKPGVAACRFRPDGRIFAVGGWDKRLRILDRTGDASPLAILKAHTDSVTAVDWAPDAAASGILASGAGDGRICLWRCFPSDTGQISR